MRSIKTAVKSLAGVGLALVGAQAAAATVTAYGPSLQSGTYIKSTTYYFCNSSSHTALDICVDTTGNKTSCGACNATNVLSMLNGTYTYQLMISGCASDCDSTPTDCGGGAGNYYQVTGSNGYDFRQLHINPNADMKTKTAARGAYLGWLGSTGSSTAPHVHADNRRSGTRLSAWYTGYVSCGSPATGSNAIGQVTLQ
ncbi:MAG TPA: peptidase M23 [Archangium sp.]|uniref:peptidase M23 n=1 Tax=Archangium sp. TaxID=1872627 RepID=UPI002E3191D8|nr:peptidase M23 [Archangium sp.]HEX5746781.1 peptidase M23 [Archangium sp.]